MEGKCKIAECAAPAVPCHEGCEEYKTCSNFISEIIEKKAAKEKVSSELKQSNLNWTGQAFSVQELSLISSRMFGGHGLYQRETFFGIIHKGRFYLKTHETTQLAYAARAMQPFRPNGRQLLTHYYEVPVDILEDAGQLEDWARRAIVPPSAQLMLPFHDHPSTGDVLAQLS